MNAYLAPILVEARLLPDRFQESFGNLNEVQLNWKPDPETWSIGECIDHLITTNRSYFAQLEAITRGDKHVSFWEKLPILHGFWGRMLIKATAEKVTKKAKVPAAFRPTRSNFSVTILSEFGVQHRYLLDLVEKLQHMDHHSLIISSPAASFVTYSLQDGLTIIFQHERRHYRQALALLTRPDFPKNT